jgi:DNA-binding transcriptional ArsR family regulator
MPQAEHPNAVAPVFAALGDQNRLSLLSQLSHGRARSIIELTRGSGLTRQGVKKHLVILEQAGVVFSVRVGRESRFALRRDGLTGAQIYLERASKQWDDSTRRLRTLIED